MAKKNAEEKLKGENLIGKSNFEETDEKENKFDKISIPKVKESNINMEQMLKDNLSCEMFHFVLNVFYSPHPVIKCFLAFFILVACGLASYTTITLVLTYMEYNVVTTMRTINETPVVFPKVTICNKNPFTSRYAYEFLSEIRTSSEIEHILNEERNSAIKKYQEIRLGLFAIIQNLSDDLKKNMSHDLNDTLLSCFFSDESCGADDFQWEWDAYFGNCFVFNSGFNSSGQKVELRKSQMEGSVFGLQIEFYVNFYEDLMLYNSITDNFGLVIRIDNVSQKVDYSHDGIFVSPGLQTYLALDRQFKTSLPKPYSNCDDLSDGNFKSDLYDLISSQSKYNYTQTFCLQQCFQELLYTECKCSDSNFASLRNMSYCMSPDEIKCSRAVWVDTYLSNNYVNRVCTPQCPFECESVQITNTLSLNELNPNIYGKLLNRNPNLSSDFINRSINDENVILKSIVKLNIFYNSLSYTSSIESPQMDIISLVASIGGNLGLFMGVCLFSLAEIIVTLIEHIFLKISTNKKVNTVV